MAKQFKGEIMRNIDLRAGLTMLTIIFMLIFGSTLALFFNKNHFPSYLQNIISIVLTFEPFVFAFIFGVAIMPVSEDKEKS